MSLRCVRSQAGGWGSPRRRQGESRRGASATDDNAASVRARAREPGKIAGRLKAPRAQRRAGTPVSAVTTGSSACWISSPIDRKKVIGAPYGSYTSSASGLGASSQPRSAAAALTRARARSTTPSSAGPAALSGLSRARVA